jgi:ElaB/YqjD/DUF883 family membrane-anchored ribosome-binding protein
MSIATAKHTGEADSVLQTALDQAKGKISQVEKVMQEQAEYAADETGRYVKRHPWTALAVAGSIGVVVGLLLTRR